MCVRYRSAQQFACAAHVEAPAMRFAAAINSTLSSLHRLSRSSSLSSFASCPALSPPPLCTDSLALPLYLSLPLALPFPVARQHEDQNRCCNPGPNPSSELCIEEGATRESFLLKKGANPMHPTLDSRQPRRGRWRRAEAVTHLSSSSSTSSEHSQADVASIRDCIYT